MPDASISIASDHGGVDQKEQISAWLSELGYKVRDHGCFDDSSVDYPDYAQLVGKDVAQGEAEFGVLVCGTGIGMMIAANKVHGVRAANVVTPQFAQLAREHNNANIVTLSGRFVSLDDNKLILETFLNTEFAGGRHERRVDKISAIEEGE